MHLDAIALGERDFIIDPDTLINKVSLSTVPFVCANMEIPGVKPYIHVIRSGLKILITSVLDPELISISDSANFPPKDPIKSLQTVLDNKFDISIVIFHAKESNVTKWVKHISNISILFVGHNAQTGCSSNAYYNILNSSVISASNNTGGQQLAWLDINIKNRKILLKDASTMDITDNNIIPDPHIEKLIQAKQQKMDLNAKIFTLQNKAKLEFGRYQVLGDVNVYTGSIWCKDCHPKIFASWEESAHAHAIDSLRPKKKENDPSCVNCHVTGMNSVIGINGFLNFTITPHLANVQCESCHGPASRHITSVHNPYGLPINEHTCTPCHTLEKDPNFNFVHDKIRGSHVTK